MLTTRSCLWAHAMVILFALGACTAPEEATDEAPIVVGAVQDTGRPLLDPFPAVDTAVEPSLTFTNPVAPATPDPHVSRHGDQVYLVYSPGDRILLRSAESMLDFADADEKEIWAPPPNTMHSSDLWGPELHEIDGRFIIYYSATDASFLGWSTNFRIWALEADGDDPWTATWTHRGPIRVPEHDAVAQHPTVFGDGRYLAWTGPRAGFDGQGRIFIAPLIDPFTVDGPGVEIISPVEAWETDISASLQAPAVVERDGLRLLVYAGSNCISTERSLGVVVQNAADSPLDASRWTRRNDPWLVSSAAQETWAPGQPSFVTSPDGTEDWLVYHAADTATRGCSPQRALHFNRIVWAADGPYVEGPTGPNTPITAPGGLEP